MRLRILTLGILAAALSSCSTRHKGGLGPLESAYLLDEAVPPTVLAAPSDLEFELLVQPSIPAFPGAEGYGAIALSNQSPNDCRSKQLNVIGVTTVNPTGTGSLEWAYEEQATTDKFDVIVFTTSGTINYPGNWIRNVTKHCVYVAGQTAPGDGIQLVGDTTITFGLFVLGGPSIDRGSSDQVWRFLRTRENSTDSASSQGTALSLVNAQRIVVADMSIELSDDKNTQIDQITGTGFPVSDLITYQDNLIYAPLPSSTGFNIHGDHDTSPDSTLGSVSLIRNLMGGNKWRWPRAAEVSQVQLVNNMIYGWTSDGIRVSSELSAGCLFPACIRQNLEVINNRWKPFGPSDRFGAVEFRVSFGVTGDPNFYASGNIHGGICTALPCDQTQWRYRNDKTGLVADSSFKASSTLNPPPFFDVVAPWTATETHDALTSITGTVGASRAITCDGMWRYVRDAVDAEFVAEARDSTLLDPSRSNSGIETTAEWLASWNASWGRAMFLNPGTACLDTDSDGMPDEFEDLCGGDPTSLAVGGDISGDGYLNIEEWLNGTNAAGRTLNWTDNSSNEGGFRIKRDKGAGFVVIATLSPDATSYFDPDARPGDDYQVLAFNVSGESAPTLTVAAACR